MTDPLENINPDDLTPAQRDALENLLAMEPEERQRFLGHIKLLDAAWAFLTPAVEEGDLLSAWPNLDPNYRTCLAQQWVLDNTADIAQGGYDQEQVAHALAQHEPVHDLWRHFERVHLRNLREVLPQPPGWGIGTNTRLVGPDLEVLYLHDTSDMPDGVWQPDEKRRVYPLLMRWTGNRWFVVNLGSERMPVPGWPPTL